jgi:hypothetical protein
LDVLVLLARGPRGFRLLLFHLIDDGTEVECMHRV